MGCNWLCQLKQDWPNIFLVCPHSLEDVLKQAKEIFTPVLGMLVGGIAQIQVHLDAQPHFFQHHSVPCALNSKVEVELQSLQKESILESIQFSSWATPIIAVVKTDGSVQICGDYKVTVNRVAKLDPYPFPQMEDLFASLAGWGGGTTLCFPNSIVAMLIGSYFLMRSPRTC